MALETSGGSQQLQASLTLHWSGYKVARALVMMVSAGVTPEEYGNPISM